MTEMFHRSSGEVAVVRRQARKTWTWLEETVGDVTSALANWWPPGTANSIGATYLHVVVNTDVEINGLICGRAPLVEGEWQGDIGQGVAYDPDRFDRWVRHVEVDWERLRAYGRSVQTAFLGSLEDLTDELLSMPVDMTRAGLGMWEGRDLFELHGTDHPRIHGGEIACLKGIQGGIGWAESDAFHAAVDVEDLGGR